MARPFSELSTERPASYNAKINCSCKCHKDCSILHTCYMSHGQLNQWLVVLPFPLHSTAHNKTNNGTKSWKISTTLWAWYWSCCSSQLPVSVYEKFPTLFSTDEDLRHENLTTFLAFRQEVKSAANGVSDATFTPCLKLSPWLPAVRPASIWTNNQPSSWVGPSNPITTCCWHKGSCYEGCRNSRARKIMYLHLPPLPFFSFCFNISTIIGSWPIGTQGIYLGYPVNS